MSVSWRRLRICLPVCLMFDWLWQITVRYKFDQIGPLQICLHAHSYTMTTNISAATGAPLHHLSAGKHFDDVPEEVLKDSIDHTTSASGDVNHLDSGRQQYETFRCPLLPDWVNLV